MRALWCGCFITLFLVSGLTSRQTLAEQILTAEGDSLSASGVTITNRQLTIPAADGGPAKQVPIDDLEEYSHTSTRQLGDLKTRYVRVEHLSPTATNLSLAEVLVFEGDKNVAREGAATQAGTDYGGTPERAIDGNTNGDYNGAQSTTHSAHVPLPWWELDLKRDVTVRQLEIWNRTDDGLHTRLSGSRVILFDSNRKPLWVYYIDTASSKPLTLKIPSKGLQFGREDIKQFERYAGLLATGPDALTDPEYRIELAGGGMVTGKVTSRTVEALSVESRFGDQTLTLNIPPTMIREMWSFEVATHKLSIDRTGEHPNSDSVYAKSDTGAVQRVVGQIVSLEGESLSIEIDGQVRQLAWSKVVGIATRQPEPDPAEFELVEFVGGQRLPGHCLNLTPELFQMETLWKQPVELPRGKLAKFSIQNGRVLSLLKMPPSRVEQVGYLDLVRPYQVNKSFSGTPLQIGDVKYSVGLCTHSQTLLEYHLNGGFTRFRSEIGLQVNDGDQGHVVVRVLIDGQIKYEETAAGGQPSKVVTVDLVGAKTLQLEVDFGEGFDVADHLVWGDPTLLKAANP